MNKVRGAAVLATLALFALFPLFACTLSRSENSGAPVGPDGALLAEVGPLVDTGGNVSDVGINDTGQGVDTSVVECQGGIVCEGACIDPTSNPDFCGNCKTACKPGQTCTASKCTGTPTPEAGPSEAGESEAGDASRPTDAASRADGESGVTDAQ
jgi:hypothetical protein